MAYGKTKKGLKTPTWKSTLKTKTYASKRRRKK